MPLFFSRHEHHAEARGSQRESPRNAGFPAIFAPKLFSTFLLLALAWGTPGCGQLTIFTAEFSVFSFQCSDVKTEN
jgi:hypothetical protein